MAVQLESEVDFQLQIENFEGPFDLLLRLIGKHELDITLISLSRVTQEFLNYVKNLDGKAEINSASEFLVIAATLLDIKIASLLPRGEVVDAQDLALLEARDMLFARLLQYRAFKQIASWFATALDNESGRIPRSVRLEERFRQVRPQLIWNTQLAEFAQLAEMAFLPREIPSLGLNHLHAPTVSIREQARVIVERLHTSGSATFRELMAGTQDRSELVARFLGLLELYRLGCASFLQPEAFADFTVFWDGNLFAMDQLTLLGKEFDD